MSSVKLDELKLDPSLLAHFLRVARKVRGLSLKQVAKQSGVAYEALWKIETGRTKDPQISTALAIVKAFGFGPKLLEIMDPSKPW